LQKIIENLMGNGKQSINPTTVQNYKEQSHLVEPSIGLTKREYFAGLAMQGILAQKNTRDFLPPEYVAQCSVQLADALLLELDKPEKP